MLGGINIPSVDDAAMVPNASVGLYPAFNIGGKAIKVITTTAAPMMPVIAAKIVAITVTDIAMPPGTRLRISWSASSNSLAISERSSITPMKTNSGTAIIWKLSAINQIRGAKLKNSISENTPNIQPITPNIIEIPPRTKPIG